MLEDTFISPAATLLAMGANSTVKVLLDDWQDFFDELELANQNGYWYFLGSLTTPPCTEGVHWYLMKNVGIFSEDQYQVLHKVRFECCSF